MSPQCGPGACHSCGSHQLPIHNLRGSDAPQACIAPWADRPSLRSARRGTHLPADMRSDEKTSQKAAYPAHAGRSRLVLATVIVAMPSSPGPPACAMVVVKRWATAEDNRQQHVNMRESGEKRFCTPYYRSSLYAVYRQPASRHGCDGTGTRFALCIGRVTTWRSRRHDILQARSVVSRHTGRVSIS